MISLFFLLFLLNSWERYIQSSLFSLLLLKNMLWSLIRFAHLVNIQINSFFCVFWSSPFSNILLNLDFSIKSDSKVYKHFHQIMIKFYFRFKDLFSEYFKISNFPLKPKNINQIKTSQFFLLSLVSTSIESIFILYRNMAHIRTHYKIRILKARIQVWWKRVDFILIWKDIMNNCTDFNQDLDLLCCLKSYNLDIKIITIKIAIRMLFWSSKENFR